MIRLQRGLNILFIFTLCGVILSAFTYQFAENEIPCSLCNLQRLGMIGISIGLLLNLRLGIRAEHYGLSLLSALFGLFTALKQIGLHVCPQFPPYGEQILGFSIFVWSFIVFLISILCLAILLIWGGCSKQMDSPPSWGGWAIAAFTLVALITAANAVTSFINCGFGYCQGI